MAMRDIASAPDGIDIFLDANIFIDAFLRTSAQCTALLTRCARESVFGFTSVEVIAEVTHRMMVAEAYKRGLIEKKSVNKLKEKRSVIAQLQDYWRYSSSILSMNLLVIELGEDRILRAHPLRKRHCLLNNDSLILAAIEDYAIPNLASGDRDFESVPGLTVYRPTDVAA